MDLWVYVIEFYNDGWWIISPIAQLQAEPLAEDPPKEQLTGAAMCTTGHVLPGALPTLLS